MGFHDHACNSGIAIVSRYPIVQFFNQGVKLQLSSARQAYVFNAHLAPYPYQPYDIRDGPVTTDAQAIAEAEAARGGSVTSLLGDMAVTRASELPVFLVDDFNEPSHLAWTQAAADAGSNFGKKVDWPASRARHGLSLRATLQSSHPGLRRATGQPG